MVRAATIAVTLPPSTVEDEAGMDGRLAIVDEKSLAATLPALVADAPGGVPVVVVLPLRREGGRGLVGRISARARRLGQVELTSACDALRREGVVGVRVLDVEGALGLAVLSGRTTFG